MIKRMFFFILLFFTSPLAFATEIYDDTTLNTGDFTTVDVFNAAVLNINGASIDTLLLHNSSTTNLNVGFLAHTQLMDTSILNLYGGHPGVVASSTIDGRINVYGYDFIYTPAGGGSESGWLNGRWGDSSVFSIYFRNMPDPFPGNQLILHVIPEPVSLYLFLAGGTLFLLRKHRL